MFKPIRKVKAAAIVGGIVSLLGMFGVDVNSELQDLLKQVAMSLIPLVPAVAAYFTKSQREDADKVVYKD